MAKLVFVYKGRYWVRDTRTLETLSAQARAAGHGTSLVYDRDLFGTSDNVLSLPRLNRFLFEPGAAAKKAASSGADWLILLENLTNGPWIEGFLDDLARAGYKGGTAVLYCHGSAPAKGSVPLFGEPEKAFEEFLRVLPGPAPEKIQAAGLAALDALPLPDLDLFSLYEDFGLSYMAYAGKGCSGACSYCEEPFYRQAYGPGYARLRRPERVLEELLAVKNRFGTRELTFKDSVFTADKAWLKTFLELYRREIALPFKCFGRSDAFDPETAALLRDSGCYCVEFGLQTFNVKLRSAVLRRPESLEAVKKAFAACDAAGLPYDADYIFGLPGETEADHLEAARRFSELKRLNRIKCHNLVYYKGLGITEQALKEGRLEKNAVSRGDFFSGDRSAPEMRGADSAFRKLFKLYGLLGGAGLRFAAASGLWRLFRFLPGVLLKPLELLSGLFKGDRRFPVYFYAYPARLLGQLREAAYKEAPANAALFCGSLALLLLAAEAALRLTARGLPELNTSALYRANHRGYYELVAREGGAGLYGLRYNTTPEGFRLPDGVAGWGASRTENAEILMIGDSFVFGRGVRYEDTCSSVLEKLLSGHGAGARVKNSGAVGLGLEEIEKVYLHETAARSYKLVVYGLVLNDFTPSERVKRGRWDLIDETPGRGRRSFSAVLDLFLEAVEKRRLSRETVRAYNAAFRGAGAAGNFDRLRRLDARVRADGGRLAVMIFPLLYKFGDYPFSEAHASLRSFCGREGIPCLDLFPVFSRHAEKDLRAAPTDQHPNELAHRLAAKALAEFLRERALLPVRRAGAPSPAPRAPPGGGPAGG